MLQRQDLPALADNAPLSADDCHRLERTFAQRAERVAAMFDLDSVLSAAANRYNLASQVVHHGWPHRAD